MKFGTDIWNLIQNNPFIGGRNPIKVSPNLPHFTANWHLHNAFSMGQLKQFPDVVCGPIILVLSWNDVSWWSPSPGC